jgi:hypothetical protein
MRGKDIYTKLFSENIMQRGRLEGLRIDMRKREKLI